MAAQIDGSVEGRDFSIDYSDGNQVAAVATYNRDAKALEVDAQWNAAIKK